MTDVPATREGSFEVRVRIKGETVVYKVVFMHEWASRYQTRCYYSYKVGEGPSIDLPISRLPAQVKNAARTQALAYVSGMLGIPTASLKTKLSDNMVIVEIKDESLVDTGVDIQGPTIGHGNL